MGLLGGLLKGALGIPSGGLGGLLKGTMGGAMDFTKGGGMGPSAMNMLKPKVGPQMGGRGLAPSGGLGGMMRGAMPGGGMMAGKPPAPRGGLGLKPNMNAGPKMTDVGGMAKPPGAMQQKFKNPTRQLIHNQVQKSGTTIPASYFDKMAKIESRYNPKAVSPTGAKGLYQFTGRTWKAYGKGDRFNPRANTQAAIKFAEDNRNYLQKKLGRVPESHELYMAHNIGPGGARRLLTAPSNSVVTRQLIGSNPQHNPKFLTNGGRPITAAEAIKRYRTHFESY